MAEIDKATSVMVKQSHVAEKFTSTKTKENLFLEQIFKRMESKGLVNLMTDDGNDAFNRFLLDISCEEMLQKNHALQSKLKINSVENPEKSESETESDEEQENWFEKDENLQSLQKSISAIFQLKIDFHQTDFRFGFGVTRKKKNNKTPGQIYFTGEFGQSMALESLPKLPIFRVSGSENTVKVVWDKVSDENVNGFEIQWQPKLQESSEEVQDSSQTGTAAQWDMASADSFQNDFEISSHLRQLLKKYQNYEVQVVVKCDKLGSILCKPFKVKTGAVTKKAEDRFRQFSVSELSAAAKLIDYFINKEMHVSEFGTYRFGSFRTYWSVKGCCLYPGLEQDKTNENIKDVASGFQRDLQPFPITHFNSSVLIFAGDCKQVDATIDAYVSFLLGATVSDPYRIRIKPLDLEDIVRLRPHSKIFQGKTLYLCKKGVLRDSFLSSYKINAIIFCFGDNSKLEEDNKSPSYKSIRDACKQSKLTNTVVMSHKNIATKNDALRDFW